MTPRPGDFFVVRTNGWAARLIQLGTFSRWNHSGIYVGAGNIVEAQPSGVTTNHVDEYPAADVVWSTLDLTDAERTAVCAYALTHRGQGYGWADIAALALVAFGIRWAPLDNYARRDDRLVCSQLVAYAYDAAGSRLGDLDPWTVTPGDLAELLTERKA